MSRSMSKTRVLYNGSCPICSREVRGYAARAKASDADVGFEDLHTTDLSSWGLTSDQAARSFHVAKDGKILSGLDAFIALWRDLPGFGWLARLVSVPGIYSVAQFGYRRFAAPLLYRMHRRRQARATKSGSPTSRA